MWLAFPVLSEDTVVTIILGNLSQMAMKFIFVLASIFAGTVLTLKLLSLKLNPVGNSRHRRRESPSVAKRMLFVALILVLASFVHVLVYEPLAALAAHILGAGS